MKDGSIESTDQSEFGVLYQEISRHVVGKFNRHAATVSFNYFLKSLISKDIAYYIGLGMVLLTWIGKH